jgi:eukaryotic-like serine/threonine-protein kinase
VIEKHKRNLARHVWLFGPDGAPTTNARHHLATQLERSDRCDEARVLREQVLEASARRRGPESADALGAEEWLAANLIKSGLIDEAKPLLAHVRDARERILGSDHEDTLRPTRLLLAIDRHGHSS